MNPVISRLKKNQHRSNESSKNRLLANKYDTQSTTNKRSISKLSQFETPCIIGAFSKNCNEFKTQMPTAQDVEDSFLNESFDIDAKFFEKT